MSEGAKAKRSSNTVTDIQKFGVTLNTYADGTYEMKEEAIGKIDDYIDYCLDNRDTEAILQNIREMDLYTLEEADIIKVKQQLLRVVSIPNLESKIKQAVLNLSNLRQLTSSINSLSNQRRLEVIYSLMNRFELFKTQTTDLRRTKDNYINNYQYILNYLLTSQELLKEIYKYSECKLNDKQEVQQQTTTPNNLKLLVFNE